MRINPYKTQLGSFLPNGILELLTIGSTAKLLYGRLCQYAGEKGYCWPAISTLAVAIGCSKTTVKKAIKELLDANLIEVEHRFSEDGDATSNLYFFLDHAALYIHPFPGGQVSTPPQSLSAPSGSETAPKENHLREAKNSKSNSNTQSRKFSAAAFQYSNSSTLPLGIETAIQRLALGQAHLNQVRLLIIKQLNSGTHETEVLACINVFNDRLPGLRNKNNPCSLLAELFRVGAGNEHLDAIKESAAKVEAAARAKTQAQETYAADQAQLKQVAEEWLNSEDGKRFIEWVS